MRTARLAVLAALCLSAPLYCASSAHAADGPVVGQPMPDRRLPTVERNATVTISQYRGKKLLLIEFASW